MKKKKNSIVYVAEQSSSEYPRQTQSIGCAFRKDERGGGPQVVKDL